MTLIKKCDLQTRTISSRFLLVALLLLTSYQHNSSYQYNSPSCCQYWIEIFRCNTVQPLISVCHSCNWSPPGLCPGTSATYFVFGRLEKLTFCITLKCWAPQISELQAFVLQGCDFSKSTALSMRTKEGTAHASFSSSSPSWRDVSQIGGGIKKKYPFM